MHILRYLFYRFFYNKTDFLYHLFVILPILALSILISIRMQLIYGKFSKVLNVNGVSGAVAARNILDSYGLNYVRIEMVSGELTDHFDPRGNVVRLSQKNYTGTSIASVGVAAHEVGHAVQYSKEYFPMKVRAFVIPATKIGSFLSIPIFTIGLIISSLKLAYFGIFLFGFVAFFQLITLPVEFNASARAIKIIREQKILSSDEVLGVKKVLWAAAMTYVVSFLSTLAQIVRLILVANSRDDD